jgi:DNA repair ATPase RecN
MLVKVQNFQSIKQAEVEVKGLTVITGENSIGKSALARAFNGVFTNLRGNAHVRNGETHSSVCVVFGDGNEVQWEKGKKVNKYLVNGKEISKVGSGVPDEVKDLGVRSVEVDGRELYPQIAKQFKSIFLIDLPPSALSSALSDVDVIQQLEKASTHARSEVRDIKSRTKIKREDLETAQTNLQLYEGFDYSKLEVYEREKDKKENAEKMLQEIEVLDRKKRILSVAERFLSPVRDVEIPTPNFDKFSQIDEAVRIKKRKIKLQMATGMIEVGLESYHLPEVPKVNDITQLEELLKKRKKVEVEILLLESVQKLGEIEDYQDNSDLIKRMEKRQKLQWGIALAEKEINKIAKELKDIQNLILEEECPMCLRKGVDKCHD